MFFKLKHFERYKFFETRFEILFVGINAQLKECGGRILLGDYAGGGALTLLPIRIKSVGIWSSTGFLLCLSACLTVNTGHKQNSTRVELSGT
jgi:hypothetical protein